MRELVAFVFSLGVLGLCVYLQAEPRPAAEDAGKYSKEITVSASAEKCPHGDDGWGEFVMAAAPAADQRQRAPDRLYLPSFSSHHEAACADLEEKQQPRVATLAGAQKGDGMR